MKRTSVHADSKVCSRCAERQPSENFYFVSKKLGTRRGQCKACVLELKAMQKDPGWKPQCPQCGKERDRLGPGRRLCQHCFDEKYDSEDRRLNGAHRLKLKPCSACGTKRLREDHVKHTSLCAVCRSIPQHRRKHLRRYNITPRMYVEMLERQLYRCWACDRKPSTTLHVDHQHAEPMLVRGLVCGRCNTIMGLARDDPWVLRGAAKFLETTPAQYMYPGLRANEEANRHDEYKPVTRRHWAVDGA
jgi:hypothetical protein